tara:strand:- start:3759 stop:4691 length:933 start_codon:yes stop_codon:yes gene_type:complete
LKTHRVGCLVLAGTDFPDHVKKQLSSWQMTLQLKISQTEPSTRGLLEYEDDTFGRMHIFVCQWYDAYACKAKKFRYITTPLRTAPSDLVGSRLLHAKMFHLLGTPKEVGMQIPQIIALRRQHGNRSVPFLLWEPFPAACTTTNRQAFLDTCKLVDVFSPNHLELCALFDDAKPEGFSTERLEKYAMQFSAATGLEGKGNVIVRAGEFGSLTVGGSLDKLWLPPFYQDGASEVVDPTGAGNTFLGGFMAGWNLTHDIKESSIYGVVAASFAIEQIGLSKLELDGEYELWNGVQAMDRLTQYKDRISTALAV